MTALLLQAAPVVAPTDVTLSPAVIVAITTAVVTILGALGSLIGLVVSMRAKAAADTIAATVSAAERLKIAEATHLAVNSKYDALMKLNTEANDTILELTKQVTAALAQVAQLQGMTVPALAPAPVAPVAAILPLPLKPPPKPT